MGSSGGRSAHHRTGAGAKRRNTQRERDLVDPPFEHPLPLYSPRSVRLMTAVAAVALGAMLAVLVLLALGISS